MEDRKQLPGTVAEVQTHTVFSGHRDVNGKASGDTLGSCGMRFVFRRWPLPAFVLQLPGDFIFTYQIIRSAFFKKIKKKVRAHACLHACT